MIKNSRKDWSGFMIQGKAKVMVNFHSTGKSNRRTIIKESTISKSVRNKNISFLLNSIK